MQTLSIVVVSYNTVDYLRECLHAIYKYEPNVNEVIVVDNQSQDGSVEMVKRAFPQVRLFALNENLGFGLGNNHGVEQANSDYVMLLNSDAILKTNTGTQLVNYLESHPAVSCVGPRVILPNTGEVQPKVFGYAPSVKHVFMQSLGLNRVFSKCAFFHGIDGEHRTNREMEVGWLSGVCMVMRKADYQHVKGFDKRFFMYCEDIDLCMKLAHIGKIVLMDDYAVMHYGGASSKTIASRVKNGIWQQQHLLTIIKDHQGAFSALVSRFLLLLGMLFRLSAALLKVPKHGFVNNESLQIAWARFNHLLGLRE